LAFALAALAALACVFAGLANRDAQWDSWRSETARRQHAHELSIRAWEAECAAIRHRYSEERDLEASRFEARVFEAQRIKQAEEAREEAQREDEQDTALIQGALLWNSTQRTEADDFAAEHWRDLIASERSLLAQYADPKNPCSTMERCLAVARRAAPRLGDEIAYLLPENQRSIEGIAGILRRRHGFAVEYLLPRAREHARRERMAPSASDQRQLAEARAEADRLDRERTGALREAGAWWTSAGRHYADCDWLERHVRTHRRRILRHIDEARAAYQDGSRLIASFEGARELAHWALEAKRGEVAYHFSQNGKGLPSEEELARILRAHHGHMVEVLIPMALEMVDYDPRSIYGRLDGEAVAQFEAAQTVVEVERVASALIERERARLVREEGVVEEDLPARVEPYAKFIREAAYKIKLERGFITD